MIALWPNFRQGIKIAREFYTVLSFKLPPGIFVTIFGSARFKPEDPYYQQTLEISEKVAKLGFGIISGGGPGAMQAANEGAYRAKRPSLGFNIRLPHEQQANPYVTAPYLFRYFFTRKRMLIDFACLFIIVPGGVGTLDEMFETITLMQTGKRKNKPVFLFDSKFHKHLLEHMRFMEEQKLMEPLSELPFLVFDDIDELVAAAAQVFNEASVTKIPAASV